MARTFLIACANDATVRTLQAALKDDQDTTLVAQDGLESVDIALDRKPQAIFLGIHLPRLDGLRVARALRALDLTEHVPIIFLAENQDEAERIAKLRLPLTDCIVEPYDRDAIKTSAESALRAANRIASFRERETDITLLAITDPLTHVYQRRYLMHRLTYEAGRSIRYKHPLSVLLVDIDNLKEINRAHGILIGDSVLIETARLIRKTTRAADLVGRYDTKDFLIALPETDARSAAVLADRIHQTIADHHFVLLEKLDLHETVSVGVASAAGDELTDYLALLGRVEAALDRAKRGGKNRVEMG